MVWALATVTETRQLFSQLPVRMQRRHAFPQHRVKQRSRNHPCICSCANHVHRVNMYKNSDIVFFVFKLIYGLEELIWFCSKDAEHLL